MHQLGTRQKVRVGCDPGIRPDFDNWIVGPRDVSTRSKRCDAYAFPQFSIAGALPKARIKTRELPHRRFSTGKGASGYEYAW